MQIKQQVRRHTGTGGEIQDITDPQDRDIRYTGIHEALLTIIFNFPKAETLKKFTLKLNVVFVNNRAKTVGFTVRANTKHWLSIHYKFV